MDKKVIGYRNGECDLEDLQTGETVTVPCEPTGRNIVYEVQEKIDAAVCRYFQDNPKSEETYSEVREVVFEQDPNLKNEWLKAKNIGRENER